VDAYPAEVVKQRGDQHYLGCDCSDESEHIAPLCHRTLFPRRRGDAIGIGGMVGRNVPSRTELVHLVASVVGTGATEPNSEGLVPGGVVSLADGVGVGATGPTSCGEVAGGAPGGATGPISLGGIFRGEEAVGSPGGRTSPSVPGAAPPGVVDIAGVG